MPTPKLSTTVAAGEDFPSLDEYVQYLAGILARNSREINWALTGNLDVANIKAKSITADLIRANTITAEKMDVSELSAISADLGHITAGLIEAVTINGSEINGAQINGGNINVQTDVYIGQNLYMSPPGINDYGKIFLSYLKSPGMTIEGDWVSGAVIINAPNRIYLNNVSILNGMDVVSEINSLKARVTALEMAP